MARDARPSRVDLCERERAGGITARQFIWEPLTLCDGREWSLEVTSWDVDDAANAAVGSRGRARDRPDMVGLSPKMTGARRVGARSLFVAVAVVLGLSGCGWPDRSGVARDIDQSINAMPGVETTKASYHTNFTAGAHFNLDVTLSESATDTEVASVGRTFVQRVREGRFDNFDHRLNVAYHWPGVCDRMPYSAALFNVTETELGGLSPDAVADDLARWVHIAHSQSVAAAQLNRTASQGPSSITVYLHVSADDAELARLAGIADLPDATWAIALPTAQHCATPRIYRSDTPPSQRTREAWQQLVDLLGPHDRAEATTNNTGQPGEPGTTADIQIDVANQAQLDKMTAALIPLVSELGPPARVRIESSIGIIESP